MIQCGVCEINQSGSRIKIHRTAWSLGSIEICDIMHEMMVKKKKNLSKLIPKIHCVCVYVCTYVVLRRVWSCMNCSLFILFPPACWWAKHILIANAACYIIQGRSTYDPSQTGLEDVRAWKLWVPCTQGDLLELKAALSFHLGVSRDASYANWCVTLWHASQARQFVTPRMWSCLCVRVERSVERMVPWDIVYPCIDSPDRIIDSCSRPHWHHIL
jgi:hypothetical protein